MQGGRGEAGWGSANLDYEDDAFDYEADAYFDDQDESDVAADADDDGAGTPTFAMAIAALSGSIVGFFVAGQFTTGAVVFVAVAVGTVLGWIARGLAS